MKAKLPLLLSVIVAVLLSVVLTKAALFLAPLPLVVLRRHTGRWPLVVAAIIGLAGLFFVSPSYYVLAYLVAVTLAAVLCEGEAHGLGYATSVFVSVVVLSGLVFLMGSFAVQVWGFDPIGFFSEQISLAMSQIKFPPEMGLDKETLLRQVPSGIVMSIIFAVWLNSVFAPRLGRIFKWARPKEAGATFLTSELLQWKLPDTFVWLALGAAAGHFLDVKPGWLKWTSTNVFNVVVMLYFFQGLAVVVSYLEAKKVGQLWRGLCYLLVFTQLFLGVAVLGFVDLWFGFRNRKKTDKSAVA